jgi:prefoldin subunit 5
LIPELEKTKKDRDALKNQANNLSKEYDRLADENAKLQTKVGGAGDKKSD